MPTFPTAGADVEVLVRGLIADKVATVPGVGNVFSYPIYVSGKQSYVDLLGVAPSLAENIEVRYLFIEWAGFEDTEDGCEDAPVYNLLYTLRVGQEFIPKRPDGGNSEIDFTAQCMALRDAFLPLTVRHFGYDLNLWSERLVLSEPVELTDDPHTGMFGHTCEFLLRIQVTPAG